MGLPKGVSFLDQLVGPPFVVSTGASFTGTMLYPPRALWELIGFTVEDDPENSTIRITGGAGGGGGGDGAVVFDTEVGRVNIRSGKLQRELIDNTKTGITSFATDTVNDGNGIFGNYGTTCGGDQAYISGDYGTICGGLNNTVLGLYGTIAGGTQNLIDEAATAGFAAGQLNEVTGAAGVALGFDCTAGASAVCMGNESSAIGAGSVVLGTGCSATTGSVGAVALGANCQANATGAISIGKDCSATGNYSSAVGQLCSASNTNGAARGVRAVSTRQAEDVYAAGRYVADGDCQVSRILLRGSVASFSGQFEMFYGEGGDQRIVLEANSAFIILCTLLLKNTGNTQGATIQLVAETNGSAITIISEDELSPAGTTGLNPSTSGLTLSLFCAHGEGMTGAAKASVLVQIQKITP